MSDQSSRWRRCGAWMGGTIAALAVSPQFGKDSLILAATVAGLYRSTDGGQQWACGQSLSDPRITAVAFAPVGEAAMPVAFAATADSRLFCSHNSGEAWQEVAAWAGLGLISTITVSPAYAADQTLFVATPEGIFRSQDGGASWESSTFGLLDLEILCLACAPNFAENELLWAGSALGGLYRSRNGARSWRDAGQGLPDMAIQCLAVSPNFAHDQTLYVGTESDGIYVSSDGGVQWQPLRSQVAGQSINCLAISPDGQTLLAGAAEGIYQSADGGRQWTRTAGDAFLALTLAIAADGTAVAGAYQEGIFRLSPGEHQWQAASDGLAAHVPPIVFYGAAHSFSLLDVEGALVYSNDEGCTWQLLNNDFGQAPVLAAAVGAQGGLLAVATAEWLYVNEPSTATNSLAWCRYPLPVDVTAPTLLTSAPALAQPSELWLADAVGQLYRADGDTMQWQSRPVPWLNSHFLQLAFSPTYSVDQTLVALTAQPDATHTCLLQIWQTCDDGREWGVLADFYADTPAAVMTLPFDPVQQSILVGVGNRFIKLYRQADQTWAVQQQFLAESIRITSIVTVETYRETGAITVTTNQGVLHSSDAGTTWAPVGEGLAGRTLSAFLPGAAERPAYAVELGGVIWRLVP